MYKHPHYTVYLDTKKHLNKSSTCTCIFVTGEKLWLAWARTQGLSLTMRTLPLPSHPIISTTTFHLNPTRSPVHEFPISFHEGHTDLIQGSNLDSHTRKLRETFPNCESFIQARNILRVAFSRRQNVPTKLE